MMTKPEDIFKERPLPEIDELLIELYIKTGKPVDYLAYSDEFEELYQTLLKHGEKRTRGQVFRRLLNLRKSGWLPRLGAA